MKVRLYRNLSSRDCWTIQAKVAGAWHPVAHAQEVMVDYATFFVSEASRLRCAARGAKEVHAWIDGTLSAIVDAEPVEKWSTPEIAQALANAKAKTIKSLPKGVTYRPFVETGFRRRDTGEIVLQAPRAVCRMADGCTI